MIIRATVAQVSPVLVQPTDATTPQPASVLEHVDTAGWTVDVTVVLCAVVDAQLYVIGDVT